MINVDLTGWTKLARVVASQAGLSIVYREGVHPSTDGKRLYLPPPPTNDKQGLMVWAGYAFHEIGHNVPAMRDCFDIIGKYAINMRSFYGMCINLVDDYRQEKYQHGRYEGRDKSLSVLHGHTLRECKEPLPMDSKEAKVLHTLFLWDALHRQKWQPDVIGCFEHLCSLNPVDPEMAEWLNKLTDYDHRYDNLQTAEEEKTLVDELLTDVFHIEPEEAKQKVMQEATSSEPQESWVHWRELLKHDHGETEPGKAYVGLHIDYSDWEEQEYSYDPTCIIIDRFSGQDSYYSKVEAAVNQVGNLSSNLRKLLQVHSQQRWEGGYKRGKLHKRALYKVSGGGVEVFKRRANTVCLDAAVTLLVDCSGSMGGNKWTTGCASAIAMANALVPNNVSLSVVGFTTHDGTKPLYYQFVSFGETVGKQDMLRRMCSTTVNMCNNDDGHALLQVLPELRAQPNEKKALIVLSDGSPACGQDGAYDFTKQVAATINALPDVSLYAIGIEDDNVAHFYKHYTVINSTSELAPCLLTFVQNHLLN